MINETLNNAEIEIAQDYFKSMLSNKRRAVSKYGADAEKIMWDKTFLFLQGIFLNVIYYFAYDDMYIYFGDGN